MADTDLPPSTPGASKNASAWERDVLTRLSFAALNEQRRARRWSVFFKSLLFIYLLAILLMYSPFEWKTPGLGLAGAKHAALVDLEGVIMPGGEAAADPVIAGLQAAFEDKRSAGVILRINSPGGSAVQAGYINDEIKRLRRKYPQTPLYAAITDVCASGGYYVAVAADKIYADKASIVGSIGVLMNGFGFTEAMDKLGVERRLLTAGASKGFLDPFSPMKPQDVQHVQGLLSTIHQQFIATVKQGRGARLKENPQLFTGLVWSGEKSVELGLIDGLGDSAFIAREILGVEQIVDYTVHEGFLQRFAGDTVKSLSGALHTEMRGMPMLLW